MNSYHEDSCARLLSPIPVAVCVRSMFLLVPPRYILFHVLAMLVCSLIWPSDYSPVSAGRQPSDTAVDGRCLGGADPHSRGKSQVRHPACYLVTAMLGAVRKGTGPRDKRLSEGRRGWLVGGTLEPRYEGGAPLTGTAALGWMDGLARRKF